MSYFILYSEGGGEWQLFLRSPFKTEQEATEYLKCLATRKNCSWLLADAKSVSFDIKVLVKG